MPFNATGVYTLPSSYVATPNTTILSGAQHNTPLEDIQSALSATVLRDGRAPMTGPLVLSGNATTPLQAVPKQQMDALTITADRISDSQLQGRLLLQSSTAALQRGFMDVPSNGEMNALVSGTRSNITALIDTVGKTTMSAKTLSGTWAFYEIGSLFPGVVPWQNGAGTAVPITEAFIRETIALHATLGIETIVLIKIEQYGWCFYPFSFTPWLDEQSNRTLAHWSTASPPGWIPTGDALAMMLDEANKFGMKIVVGTGKDGDDYLALDLAIAGSGVSTSTSAALSAKTKAARQTQAITRACQIAQDIYNLYGTHPAFGGFYISHEPDSIDACVNLFEGITTTGGGGYPAMKSYGVPIWMSPGDVDDFPLNTDSQATWEAKAVTFRRYGVTHCMPQDAVGSGENISNVATWNPANRISMLRQYYGQWARLRDAVNEAWRSFGTSVIFGINSELFQMDGPNYTNAYPAAYTRVQSQIVKGADQMDMHGWYGIFPYGTPSTLSLKLPQTYAGKTDFRTRADALYSGLKLIFKHARQKAQSAFYAVPRVTMMRDTAARLAPANATTTFTVGWHHPQIESTQSLIRITLWMSRGYVSGISVADMSLYPVINGIAQTAYGGPIASRDDVHAGPITLEMIYAHEGFGFSVGWQAAIIAGVSSFTANHAQITVEDIRGTMIT